MRKYLTNRICSLICYTIEDSLSNGSHKMEEVWSYIRANTEWIFSGIGVAVISLAVYLFKRRSSKQYQRGGKGSTNIQAGGDININKRDD